VLIDGGSRPDFPTVMMKILQTGVSPKQIRALVYQHYDPDLCGSIPNFEDMIAREDLEIISARPNHMFIRHYASRAKIRSFRDINSRFRFSSGRELLFKVTPFAHSAGSSITFDPTSGILFTSDLLGSMARSKALFLALNPSCRDCAGCQTCPDPTKACPFHDIMAFQQYNIPSNRALHHAIGQIRTFPFKIIAPQHGFIINDPIDAAAILHLLEKAEGMGIDGVLDRHPAFQKDIW